MPKNPKHQNKRALELARGTRRRAMTTTAREEETLTEYELQRLAHVRRNREYMARLGVTELARDVMTASTSATTSTTTSRRKKPREATVPTRRSSRVLGTKPTHDGSAIDALEEEEEGSKRRRKRTPKANGEDIGRRRDRRVRDVEGVVGGGSREIIGHASDERGGTEG